MKTVRKFLFYYLSHFDLCFDGLKGAFHSFLPIVHTYTAGCFINIESNIMGKTRKRFYEVTTLCIVQS